MSRTAWWQPRARAWRWPPPTLRTCSTGCCSNGTVRSEEHTSELQSPCNLVCRLLSSEKHTSELQSPCNLVCRLLLEKKKTLKKASTGKRTSVSLSRTQAGGIGQSTDLTSFGQASHRS